EVTKAGAAGARTRTAPAAIDGYRSCEHDQPDPLRGREPEPSAAIVAAKKFDDEAAEGVEREKCCEDLAVVALPCLQIQDQKRSDRERRERLVELRGMHGERSPQRTVEQVLAGVALEGRARR